MLNTNDKQWHCFHCQLHNLCGMNTLKDSIISSATSLGALMLIQWIGIANLGIKDYLGEK